MKNELEYLTGFANENLMCDPNYETEFKKEVRASGYGITFQPSQVYFNYFLEKLKVGIPGKSIILDLGVMDFLSDSNISYIALKNNYKTILIDNGKDVKDLQILYQQEKMFDSCNFFKATIIWHEKIFKSYHLPPVTTLDNLLMESGMDLDSIICCDFDIDGGEFQIWEQSKILKKVRPPLVVLEVNLLPTRRLYDLDDSKEKGRVTYRSAIKIGRDLNYIPVMYYKRNLYFIAEEYKSCIDHIYSPKELFEPYTYIEGRLKELKNEITRFYESGVFDRV